MKNYVFLSPSTQDYNEYLNGGSEQYYMNLIADAMQPLLSDRDIDFSRNNRNGNVQESVRLSNSLTPSLHVALHSNASPMNTAGQMRGIDVYHYPGSTRGGIAAEIFVKQLSRIYPGRVRAMTSSTMYELRKTKVPAVLLEIGYHDNPEDERWIKENIDEIALAIVKGIDEYLSEVH